MNIYSGTKAIAEYVGGTLDKEYIYLRSKLLATLNSSGTPTYHHNDHLSARVSTDSAGTSVGEQAHYPFGEEWLPTSGSPATNWEFTNYERDSESGLNYATFRFDSSRLGRFMTPDLLAGSIANPQSLNRYAYVLNDPINLIDPLGLRWCYIHPFTEKRVCFDTVDLPYKFIKPYFLIIDPSQEGEEQDRIAAVLNAIRGALLNDQNCLDFLNRNGTDTLATLNSIIDLELFGHAQITAVRGRDIDPIGIVAISPGASGQAITVNRSGGFFNGSVNGGSLTLTGTRIRGGTIDAQVITLLHELGHMIEPNQSLPRDAGVKGQVGKNNRDIQKHCKDTIKNAKQALQD